MINSMVAISDTHNRHGKIQFTDEMMEADLIAHSGDATGRGEIWECEAFLKWYGKLDFAHKIFVAGNHDWMFEKHPGLARKMCEDNGIILLDDELLVLEDKIFWGSPWTPWFYSWAFNAQRGEQIKKHWDKIPPGVDILITHGPPVGILDEVLMVDGESYTPPKHVGCEDLAEAIKRVKPAVHIFGHIHCGYGQKHIDGVSYYNAAVCDEMYMPTNAPHLIYLGDEK